MPRSGPFRFAPPGASELCHHPELELVLVTVRECERGCLVRRLPIYGHTVREVIGEGVDETLVHEVDGQVSDVNADPLPTQPMCSDRCRAAAAERIEHDVAWIGGGLDDACEQGFRFLCRIP
jgi:hypothetical protein